MNNFFDLFFEQVKKNPHSIAAVADNSKITYGELNKKSSLIAKYLINRGVKRGDLIGICTSLNINFIISLLGILKSGAVYFPLDPEYPQNRLEHMLNDGNPTLILTDSKYMNFFKKRKTLPIDLEYNQLFDSDDPSSEDSPSYQVDPDNLAYVIYTSGSTGKPKGIMVKHESLTHIALGHKLYYPSNMKMLVSGGVCFDASLLVIFHGLANGNSLYLFSSKKQKNYNELSNFIKSNSINYIISTPSQYAKLLQEGCKFPSLKCVSLTGENLPKNLISLHSNFAPNAFLYNEYGPTECAIGTTIATIYNPNDYKIQNITVGKPLPNTQIYILDDAKKILPQGEKGEIYISSIGLAKGYLNNEALTTEKFSFVKLSNNNLIRIYKTGDLGRLLPDGNLVFLGRIEHVDFISGNWIHLGEVEYYISQCPQVKESILLVRKDSNLEKKMIAFVIPSQKGLPENFLQIYLRQILPNHMIPSSIIEVEEFPLSPNGKIDREALEKLYG